MLNAPLRSVLLAVLLTVALPGGALAGPPSIAIRGAGEDPAPGPAGVHIEWATGDGQPGHLYRVDPGRPPQPVGFTAGWSTIDLPGVPPGVRTEFQLRQIGFTDRLLATAIVQDGRTTVRVVSTTAPPPDAPRWVDPVMQGVPWLVALLFAGLAGAYLRSLRGLRHA